MSEEKVLREGAITRHEMQTNTEINLRATYLGALPNSLYFDGRSDPW